MEEINLSTLMLIGIDDYTTKVITYDGEFIVNMCARDIINDSCKNFGSSLKNRIKMTDSIIHITSKPPIIIEETRDIIFFPLRSPRLEDNIWISFNNLERYEQENSQTALFFKKNKKILIDFSYYVLDNQVTKAILFHYELNKRRKSL